LLPPSGYDITTAGVPPHPMIAQESSPLPGTSEKNVVVVSAPNPRIARLGSWTRTVGPLPHPAIEQVTTPDSMAPMPACAGQTTMSFSTASASTLATPDQKTVAGPTHPPTGQSMMVLLGVWVLQ
jgi:hypothetical protein